MRNLNFGLLILFLISAAVFAGCSNGPSTTDPAANSRPGNSNIAANGGPQNSAVSNNSPGTTDAGNNEYPQSVTDEFVAACEGTGAKRDDCECVFEKVKQEYTFNEFSEIESKINAGEPADEFVRFSEKARAECLK